MARNPDRLRIFVSHPSDYPTDCAPHGDGLLAYELIRRLAERGHQLDVACREHRIEGPLPANLTLHPVVCRVPSAAIRQVEYLWRVRTLFRRLHRRQPFDVIHQLNPAIVGHSALLTGFGVPLVLGHFVLDWAPTPEELAARAWRNWRAPTDLVPPLLRWASRHQQAHAAALVLSTEAARAQLAEPETVRSRCVVLPYAVDSDRFTPDGPPADVPRLRPQRVLYLGRFEVRKGVGPLAEAWTRLRDAAPGAELVLVGGGPLEGELRETLREPLAEGRARLLPGVARMDVPALLRSADLVVVPSSWGEPFGMAALEAMACGRAVLGTRAGGLAHLIDERGGRLVPPGDPEALAAAMAEMLARPDTLVEMGRFNRELARTRYAWPQIVERIEEVYRKAAEG